MAFVQFIRARNWPVLFGYLLFIGMMATGYYYNVTFIQLGLTDLGTRVIGMSEQQVATYMACLALITCAVALLVGWRLKQREMRFTFKLRVAFVIATIQTILTAAAPSLRSETLFLGWIVVASLAFGIGVPVTFSMTVDLIPTRDRGYVAALITSAAYMMAAVLSSEWHIEQFSAQFFWLMLAGSAGLGVLAFKPWPLIEALAAQHTKPAFGRRRFVSLDQAGRTRVNRSLLGLIVVMFGIYFVDSLGFLRLVDTPVYMSSAWQSEDVSPRLFIGAMHVLGALIAGILYTALDERRLFLWIFGIFALVHLMYGLHIRTAPDTKATLSMPMLYAIAVSLYTVVNFAVWADISTPQTISLNAALGIALSGFTATFLSTALAIQWQFDGMTLSSHLNIVDAVALLFFLALVVVAYMNAFRFDRRQP